MTDILFASSDAEFLARMADEAERADQLNDAEPRHTFTPTEIAAYRAALERCGFTPEQIAAQIAKDCVPAFEVGFLSRPQAGGVR